MMNKTKYGEFIVSNKTAQLASRAGFNIICGNAYVEDNEYCKELYGILFENEIYAPTQTILKEWLKTKGYLIEISIDKTSQPKYCFECCKYEHFGNYTFIKNNNWYLYRSEEEALEDALTLILENYEI